MLLQLLSRPQSYGDFVPLTTLAAVLVNSGELENNDIKEGGHRLSHRLPQPHYRLLQVKNTSLLDADRAVNPSV